MLHTDNTFDFTKLGLPSATPPPDKEPTGPLDLPTQTWDLYVQGSPLVPAPPALQLSSGMFKLVHYVLQDGGLAPTGMISVCFYFYCILKVMEVKKPSPFLHHCAFTIEFFTLKTKLPVMSDMANPRISRQQKILEF